MDKEVWCKVCMANYAGYCPGHQYMTETKYKEQSETYYKNGEPHWHYSEEVGYEQTKRLRKLLLYPVLLLFGMFFGS